METKKYSFSVAKGVMVATVLFIILVLSLAVIMVVADFNDKVYNVAYAVLCSLSLVVGAVVAARTNESKGWLVGAVVGLLFYIVLTLVSLTLKSGFGLGLVDFAKLAVSVFIGMVAGILGINL